MKKGKVLFACILTVVALAVIMSDCGIAAPMIARDKSMVLSLSFEGVKEGTAHDISGRDNHARLVGRPKLVPGKSGKGLMLDGVNDMIVAPKNKDFDMSDQVAVGLWVKPATALPAKGHNPVFAGKLKSYWLQYTSKGADSTIKFFIVGDRYYSAWAKMKLKAGEWYHLMGSYDGKLIRLYVNGREVGHQPVRTKIKKAPYPFAVGAFARKDRKQPFHGIVDEVMVDRIARKPGVAMHPTQSTEGNIALGKKYVLQPEPNYGLTKRSGTDMTDLTDGFVSARKGLWFEPKAVSWEYRPLMRIIIDLERVEPISAVRLHLLGGGSTRGEKLVPSPVEVFAGEDGRRFYRVAVFNKATDRENYGLREETGEVWTDWLKFEGLKARGRYVALILHRAGVNTALDEIEVIKGEHALEDATQSEEAIVIPEEEVRFLFPREIYRFSRNISTPQYFGCLDTRKGRREPIDLTITCPPGLTVEAARFGGDVLLSPRSWRKDSDFKFVRETDANGNNLLKCRISVGNTRHLGKLFLRADGWKDGDSGEITFHFTWGPDGRNSCSQSQKVEAFSIPRANHPGPELVFESGVGIFETAIWPDVFAAMKHLGINTVPVTRKISKTYEPLYREIRAQGFQVSLHESPFFSLRPKYLGGKGREIFCQFEDGTVGSVLCPSYTGKYYRDEIARLVNSYRLARPDWVFLDTEIWGWKGPEGKGATRCSRCKAAFAKSGLASWDEFFEAMGKRMMADMASAFREEAGKLGLAPPRVGSYNIPYPYLPEQQGVYMHSWRFEDLQPGILQVAQPSCYSPLNAPDLLRLRGYIADIRRKFPGADIIPWLTLGDFGEFPPVRIEYELYESLLNGARGVNWWSARHWEPEKYAHYARVISSVAGVEEIILQGKRVSEIQCSSKHTAALGIRKGNQMLLLVSNYHDKLPIGDLITFSGIRIVKAVDRQTGEVIERTKDGTRLIVTLKDKQARLLLLTLADHR